MKNLEGFTKRIESLEVIDSLLSSFENITDDDMEDYIIFEIEKSIHGALEFYANNREG